jgi:uncharacterized paraquat-inducible protein A
MSCGCKPRTGPDFDPDFEGPSCEDLDRFNADIATCPECDADLYHDSAICPSCGHAIIERARAGWPKQMVAGVTLVLVAALLFLVL